MTVAVLVAIALAVALAIAALVIVARRPRRRAVAPAEGVLPVVLVHGFMGFDRIANLHYFRGIVDHLASLGCHAHAVRLPGAASVPERARVLTERIAAMPHDRVDIVAHSLGGLDARYALARLGLAAKVRSLVTIGTPHRGTPLADLAIDGPLALARKALATLGMPLAAIDWLSIGALDRFNRDVPDVPGVRYACVVGGIRHARTPVSLALAPSHAYLKVVAGANDGLVPIASQYWGETLIEVEADHFAQVGWQFVGSRSSFDALGLYAFVVARLGDVAKPAAHKMSA